MRKTANQDRFELARDIIAMLMEMPLDKETTLTIVPTTGASADGRYFTMYCNTTDIKHGTSESAVRLARAYRDELPVTVDRFSANCTFWRAYLSNGQQVGGQVGWDDGQSWYGYQEDTFTFDELYELLGGPTPPEIT